MERVSDRAFNVCDKTNERYLLHPSLADRLACCVRARLYTMPLARGLKHTRSRSSFQTGCGNDPLDSGCCYWDSSSSSWTCEFCEEFQEFDHR